MTARKTAPQGPGHAAARWGGEGTPPGWLPIAALAGLAAALYARGFTVGLVGDDYTLLDAALRFPLLELLSGKHGILGYYRPVSRELYFWGWGRVAGGDATLYHVVNAVTYAAVVAMFYALLRRWAGRRAAVFSATALVLFPPGGALLSWVSCAQDLIALFWGVAALLLYRSGYFWRAGLAVALAALSKETAVIVPIALCVMEWVDRDPARARGRFARLLPAFLGIAVAIALSVAVRASWPAGTSIAIWSPRQLVGAWHLPLDFLLTLWPPDTGAGIATALRSAPLMLALAAALALLVVPGGQSSRGFAAGVAAREAGLRPDRRGAFVFGVALAVLGMLPVGVIIERWRGYFFSFAALGSSVVLGILLARLGLWPARILLAVAAVVNFGSNSAYRPVEASWAPARHPHVNYAFFRVTADLTHGLLSSLEPSCPSIRSVPKTFTVGVPQQTFFENMLGPGLRVTCRDTAARVRSIDQLGPGDVAGEFGLLHVDVDAFFFQHADADVKASLGDGFLLSRRYDMAAACFEAAAIERPNDPELIYRRVTALAADGRGEEARVMWREITARARRPQPEALAARLTARRRQEIVEDANRTTLALTRGALADPSNGAAHAALGRHLLQLGAVRQATLELAAAYGMRRDARDLSALADGYEAMGAQTEARAARAQASSLAP